MKNSPQILAFFFVAITIFRVASFLRNGMLLGWLGVAFAIGLAAGVYVASYFTQFKETRNAALIALVFFAAGDLWFNELEMIRSISPENLIPPAANFLSFNATSIEAGLHISAVVFGALPTIFAALLGWLQADAAKVAILNKKSFAVQILAATKATLTRGIKATLEDWFGKEYFAALPSGKIGNQPLLSDDGIIDAETTSAKVRWEDLLSADKTEIAGMSTRQVVAKWHVSERTARNWKSRVEAGQ